jgi:hypothetical protein
MASFGEFLILKEKYHSVFSRLFRGKLWVMRSLIKLAFVNGYCAYAADRQTYRAQ